MVMMEFEFGCVEASGCAASMITELDNVANLRKIAPRERKIDV